MHVVSDTSPLSCLASIRRLDLIQRQFGVVHIPPTVKAEAVISLPRSTGAVKKKHAGEALPDGWSGPAPFHGNKYSSSLKPPCSVAFLR